MSKNTDTTMLKKAVSIVDEFLASEYEEAEPVDWKHLDRIPIAFTDTEDGEHEIEVYANLFDCQIFKCIDQRVIVEQRNFKNLEDMIDRCLNWLDFNELTAVTDEQLYQFYGYNFSEMEEAKLNIKRFYLKEYDNRTVDFNDLCDVAMAYTTTEDGEHNIEVAANLLDWEINTYIDNRLVDTETYKDLADMNDRCLSNFDFDLYVSVTDEQIKFAEERAKQEKGVSRGTKKIKSKELDLEL